MKKKSTYSSVDVDSFDILPLLPLLVSGCILALDIAKEKMVLAITSLSGELLRLVRFSHPVQSPAMLALVKTIQAHVSAAHQATASASSPPLLRVVMEPTGTYGDSLRYQFLQLNVPVSAIRPKAVHDSRELLDGVPSSHDGKSAVLLAKLAASNVFGMEKPWPLLSDERRQLRALVDQRALHLRFQELAFGRLEALQARHWPELGRWLNVREQLSTLVLLSEFGGPASVQQQAEQVVARLRAFAHGKLSEPLLAGVIEQTHSLGLPMLPEEEDLLKDVASLALHEERQASAIDKKLAEKLRQQPGFEKLAQTVGTYTAAVLVSYVNPLDYGSAREWEKACGLNLKETSSGEKVGKKSLTKRGPSLVRKVLYMAALRLLQKDGVMRAWYEQRGCYQPKGSKVGAVVAVERKLCRALWHVARGADFDATKLVDVRRLKVEPLPAKSERTLQPRTEPRTALGSGARKRNQKKESAQPA